MYSTAASGIASMAARTIPVVEGMVGRIVLRRTGSLWTMAGLIASRGFVATAGFLTSAVWARAFSKEVYGKYQIVIAAATVVGTFCLPGLNDAALISAAKKQDGNLAAITRQRIWVSIAGAIALVVWGALRYASTDAA